jgi:hypothetical protein
VLFLVTSRYFRQGKHEIANEFDVIRFKTTTDNVGREPFPNPDKTIGTMVSDPDLIERIDAMGISIERNLAVTVLFVNIYSYEIQCYKH